MNIWKPKKITAEDKSGTRVVTISFQIYFAIPGVVNVAHEDVDQVMWSNDTFDDIQKRTENKQKSSKQDETKHSRKYYGNCLIYFV